MIDLAVWIWKLEVIEVKSQESKGTSRRRDGRTCFGNTHTMMDTKLGLDMYIQLKVKIGK